jgi:uroporphyrinogen-III decarboxylase
LRHVLHIDYDPAHFEQNRLRMEARAAFRVHDRVPVAYCVVPRFFAPIFGIPYGEIFRDAETQYHWLLKFAKYRMERIREDIRTGPVITVAPYFDNVTNASAFGAEIGWSEHETPRAIPTLRDPGRAERLEPPDAMAGLWGKAHEWRAVMRELARETRVTVGGVEGRVEVALAGIGGEGPHMVAIDLVGEDLYWWQVERPDTCHRLLRTITDAMISAEERFRVLDPGHRGGYGIAEDAAQVMSAEMFRDFCVPYAGALYDRFGAGLPDGRGMHMCGDSTHLLPALRDDLRISSFNLFGYRVEPEVVARELGGRAYLWGNLDPMLLKDGTPGQVREAALRCLSALAPGGGLILGDGANVCPGTPLENLAALTEAAEEYGRPEVTFPIRPVAGEQIAAVVGDRAR